MVCHVPFLADIGSPMPQRNNSQQTSPSSAEEFPQAGGWEYQKVFKDQGCPCSLRARTLSRTAVSSELDHLHNER
jgi:hypothetical protein